MNSRSCGRRSGALITATVLLVLLGSRSQEQVGKGDEKNTTSANDKVLYALKLTKGQSYDVRLHTKQQAGSLGEVGTGLGYRLKVKSVDDLGIALVDCTVKRC